MLLMNPIGATILLRVLLDSSRLFIGYIVHSVALHSLLHCGCVQRDCNWSLPTPGAKQNRTRRCICASVCCSAPVKNED